MREAKFTKGPWFVDDWSSDCGCLSSINTSSHHRAVEVVTSMIDDVIAGRENKELKANLHLIASAPEMYAMLESIAISMECEHGVDTNAVFALLKKARGEL
jgi:hypothetical protein